MKRKSSPATRRSISAAVVICVILALALILEGLLTQTLARRGAARSAGMLLDHVETILDSNDQAEEQEIAELKEEYIARAETVAYILDENPALVNEPNELKKIADFQSVDEIHIFNSFGKIISGTVPEYYGFSFDSGEQMAYFKPMLQDKTLTMCQDVTPNTAAGKNMMYAIVWDQEGKRMVQVGIEPTRLLAEMAGHSIENVLSDIPLPSGYRIYAVDSETMEIAASTDADLAISSVPEALRDGIGNSRDGRGSGLVRVGGRLYYCSYRSIGDYVIAAVYSMRSSALTIVVPLLLTAAFILIAAWVIWKLNDRVYRAGEKLRRALADKEKADTTVSRIHEVLGSASWKVWYAADGQPARVEWSDELRRLLGYTDENDFPNTMEALLDRLHPDDRSLVDENGPTSFEEAGGRSGVYSLRMRLKTRDGEYRVFRDSAQELHREDGSVELLYGVLMDITDSEKTQIELQESMDTLENIHSVLGAADWHVHFTHDGGVQSVDWGRNIRELLGGYTEKELPDTMQAWIERLHPDDAEQTMLDFRLAVRGAGGDRPFSLVYRMRTRERGYRWFRTAGRMIRRPEEETDLMFGITQDIHEQELAKRRVEDTIAALEEDEEILRSAGFGIWRFRLDETGHIDGMSGNAQWKHIYGLDDTNLSPEDTLAVFVNGLEDPSSTPTQFDFGPLPNDYVVRLNFAWKHPEKGIIYIDTAGTKHVNIDGKTEVSGYAADVTEQTLQRQQYENDLIEARKAAEAANGAKTAFLFSMSHDIRTPMNAIMGFHDLLEKYQDDPAKRADYLRKIGDSSRVLLSIINNVLEMARIEKGALTLDEMPQSAQRFNDDLYSEFEELMRARGLAFTRQVTVRHPWVYCDPTKLGEIFRNLLSNACKYTERGSVHMELREIDSDREGIALYRTTITDTGIGMSEEFLPHIFEEFAREQNTTEAKVEGTGLGMPIVKRLVDLMGGTIEIRSRKGEGSVFTVTIPHRIAEVPAQARPEEAPDPVVFEGKRLLLAEDNDLNAEIAEEILAEAGFVTERAADGAICLDMLRDAAAGYYAAVLMDIQMPNMNGYEAARAIRALPDAAKANIPILAMTANAFAEDRREALNAGMNGHIAKPIDVKALLRALADVLG